MTEEEKQDLNKIICGSSLFNYECGEGGRLIYDGTIFRCCSRPVCYRVTPRVGKLVNHYWMERAYVNGQVVTKKIDELKRSIANKKIRQLKDFPEFAVMKLVKNGEDIRIDIDGKLVHPKHFAHHWWKFVWVRDF
jgi:hypothetical protein